jgi:hypothetical protein
MKPGARALIYLKKQKEKSRKRRIRIIREGVGMLEKK